MVGDKRLRHTLNVEQNLQGNPNLKSLTRLSSLAIPKENMYAKRRMKCDMSLRQMHKLLLKHPLGKRICVYLSEVGQHVRTSFTHLSEEDN